MYTDLNQCNSVYMTQINHVTADQQNTASYKSSMSTWCQQHMSAANYQVGQCVEKKLADYANENNLSLDSVRTSKSSEFNSACGGSTSSTVATTTTGTGTAATGTTACAPTDSVCITQAAANSQLKAGQTVAQQKAAADAAAQLAAQQKAQQQQQGSSGSNPAAMIAPLLNMAGQMGGSSPSGSSGDSGASAGSPPSSVTNNYYNSPAPSYAQPNPSVATTYDTPWSQNMANDVNRQIAATNAANGFSPDPAAVTAASKNVPSALQSDAKKVDDAIQQKDNIEPPATPGISGAAQSGSNTLKGKIQKLNGLNQLLCKQILPDDPNTSYKQTMWAIARFVDGSASDPCSGGGGASGAESGGNTQAGNSGKGGTENISNLIQFDKARLDKCAPAAEKAEKLCVESDSMKAARTLMDAAGPVLLGMNAAQKTCGGMADVTKFVGGALTAANGICMAVKMQCESTCQGLAKQLSAASNTFSTNANSVNDAHTYIANACKTYAAKHPMDPTAEQVAAQCTADNESVFKTATDAVNHVKQIASQEQQIDPPGTVPNLDAKCKDKMRNIVGLLSNIGAIALAMNSAKKCEKDLATAAAQGNTTAANVSTQEYCSAAETKDTQFCKCQGNSTAQGCSVAVLASNPNDPAADPRGVDLKNFGGASGFAGAGNLGSAAAGSYHGYGADGSGVDQTGQALLSGASSPGAGAAIPGMSGGLGATAAGADGKVDAKTAAKADDKKWSFGSFANSIGSALGFGNNSKFEGNGSISAPAKSAIERKIASDRYAAEVSPSTGADNFSKVKRSYVRKGDTFMAAP